MKLPKFLFDLVSVHKTSLGDNLAFPPEEDYSFDYKILKNRFSEVVNNIKSDRDIESLDEKYLINLLASLMKECKEKEQYIRNNLVKLCENIVNDTLNIPDETIILNCNLVEKIKPSQQFRLMPEDSDAREFNFEDLMDFDNASKVILKRRMMNSLIQGASYKLFNLYENYIDEINKLDDSLPNIYRKITLINDYLLFVKEEKIDDNNPMQGSCVEVMIGTQEEKTEINAQGLIFPFLLNETFRGFMELFASHGLPDDIEKATYIVRQADFLLAEPWDLRMGVKLWEILSSKIKDSKAIPYFFTLISKLPVDEFNNNLKEIFANTKLGEKIKDDLYHKSIHMMRMNGIENSISKKNQNVAVLTDSYLSSDELDSFMLDDDELNDSVIEEDDNDDEDNPLFDDYAMDDDEYEVSYDNHNNNYRDIIEYCNINDIVISDEQISSSIKHINILINNVKIPYTIINFNIETKNIETFNNKNEVLNKVHITIDKSLHHLDLAYMLYSKAIDKYGNIYSGSSSKYNDIDIPKVWDKLKEKYYVSRVIATDGRYYGIKAEKKINRYD